MKSEEIIDVAKRMVKEYFNRFIHSVNIDYEMVEVYGQCAPLMIPVEGMKKERKIDLHEIEVIGTSLNSNGDETVQLMVAGEDYDVYNVVWNHKDKKLSSFIQYH